MSVGTALRSLWSPPTEAVPTRAAAGTALVEAVGITVERGGNRILEGADLVARVGEVVALVGLNGAGKSTLLGATTGEVAVRHGSVRTFGAPLGEWSEEQLARRRAVLPQHVDVAFPFTVEEVVRLGRAPWRGTTAEDVDDLVVAEAMAACDITHLAHRSVPSLSGGERARTALARVLAQDAQLLLLDEPTAALDIHHQELTLRVVADQARAGAAAVVVLHDLGLAAAHADRIVVLAEGRVVADGPPDDVLDADLLSEVYRHPIEVIPHPRTGQPLVVPRR